MNFFRTAALTLRECSYSQYNISKNHWRNQRLLGGKMAPKICLWFCHRSDTLETFGNKWLKYLDKDNWNNVIPALIQLFMMDQYCPDKSHDFCLKDGERSEHIWRGTQPDSSIVSLISVCTADIYGLNEYHTLSLFLFVNISQVKTSPSMMKRWSLYRVRLVYRADNPSLCIHFGND